MTDVESANKEQNVYTSVHDVEMIQATQRELTAKHSTPKNRFLDDFHVVLACPPLGVLTHLAGSLPGLQNERAEADVPKSRTSMGLWNKIPSEYPTGFFKLSTPWLPPSPRVWLNDWALVRIVFYGL